MQKISIVSCWVTFRNALCLWYSLDKTIILPNRAVMTEHMPSNVNSQPGAGQTWLGCHLPQQQWQRRIHKSNHLIYYRHFAVGLVLLCNWHFLLVFLDHELRTNLNKFTDYKYTVNKVKSPLCSLLHCDLPKICVIKFKIWLWFSIFR